MAQNTHSRNDRLDGYIPVAERVEKFYERFPEGRIITQIIEHIADSGFVLVRAEVFRTPDDAQPASTGHAFEVRGESYVNKTSYIENAETSSVGRALALLGFEVKRGIASREEVEKVERMQTDKGQSANRAAHAAPARETAAPTPVEKETAAAAEPFVESSDDFDTQILQSAVELGYDAAKVRRWVNQKFEVTGGLGSLTDVDKKEVLKIFREQARTAQAKTARK